MSEAKVVKWTGPFSSFRTYDGKKDFDQYYYDISEKEVFVDSGLVDSEGDKLGSSQKKFICKKIDISEYLEAQRDSVGVEAYMKNLAIQGVSSEEFKTLVKDEVQDFSKMPDTLADVMLSGDAAKAAFKNLDPALRGDHTTIEGFLNALTMETIDSYIKGKIDALTPKKNEAGGDK